MSLIFIVFWILFIVLFEIFVMENNVKYCIDIVLFIFYQDYDVLLVSYVDNGLGVWIYGDVVENKYVF